ncbi:META domain-containing protein [Leptodesmis sichuanensis]|uniref:META domain-containing protein n=1 Tax=Leptodesmis sichuanensis TaxID=2906798 RepID=UPI001F4594F4|nr:META domain-containing protein [Leptodesmis sichuanensis]UIE37706.1 META domain-containing protein [Leptodesmis sichuanensis A121]
MNNQHLSLNSSRAWISAAAIGISGMLIALPAIAQSTQNPTSPTLEGRWRLVNSGERPTPPVDPQATPITAEFSDGRLFGSGGCNRYTTSYQTTGQQLQVGTISSTRMACPEPIMELEFRYLTALQGAQSYTIDQQGLQITYKTTEETGVLRFVAEPPPEPSSFIIHW